MSADSIPTGNQFNSILNYSRVTPQIATSGLIKEYGLQELTTHNFKTIIDLRTAAEGTQVEKIAVDKAGMTYTNIPVTVAGIDDTQLAAFTKALERAESPVLVHCGSGSRAGAMWARYRISKGIDPELALEEGRKAGMAPAMERTVKDAIE